MEPTQLALFASLCIVCFPLTAAFADMMKDSPVTFPDKGALPSKHPPDVKTWHESPEKDYSIFGTPQRSLAQIAAIQAEMVQGEFTPPKPDWTHLTRTRRILTEGGELHVLAMGDSIVNGTMRSAEVHPHVFYWDRVHANEFGEQILLKILMEFFKP